MAGFAMGEVPQEIRDRFVRYASREERSDWEMSLRSGDKEPTARATTHIRWTLDNDLSYVGPDNTGNVEFVARIQ